MSLLSPEIKIGNISGRVPRSKRFSKAYVTARLEMGPISRYCGGSNITGRFFLPMGARSGVGLSRATNILKVCLMMRYFLRKVPSLSGMSVWVSQQSHPCVIAVLLTLGGRIVAAPPTTQQVETNTKYVTLGFWCLREAHPCCRIILHS